MMLGPNSTQPPCVACFCILLRLHPPCTTCRMGLSSQLASLMTLPTPLPMLLAPQEQPGQGLRDRRPWVPCRYRVCCILYSFVI